jgi:hypothetical protein
MNTDLSTIGKNLEPVDSLAGLRAFLADLHTAWNRDPETAHGIEDDLKNHVLQLVADGHPDAQAIAREVLVMNDWEDVDRWYA